MNKERHQPVEQSEVSREKIENREGGVDMLAAQRLLKSMSKELGSLSNLHKISAELASAEAEESGSKIPEEDRMALVDSQSVIRRAGRSMRRLLTGVALLGALGESSLEARRFLSGQETQADAVSEKAENDPKDSNKEEWDKLKILVGKFVTASKAEEVAAGNDWDEWGPPPFPELTAEEKKERAQAEVDAKKQLEEETRKRDEEYNKLEEKIKSKVSSNSKLFADKLLSAARDVSSGSELYDMLMSLPRKQNPDDYVDGVQVERQIRQDAERLESVDPRTAKKLYEFLGEDDSLQFALRHGDQDTVYEDACRRLSAVAEVGEDAVYYPDNAFLGGFESGDAYYSTLASLNEGQREAVAGLLSENIEKLRAQIKDIKDKRAKDEWVGEVDEGQMQEGVDNMRALLEKIQLD